MRRYRVGVLVLSVVLAAGPVQAQDAAKNHLQIAGQWQFKVRRSWVSLNKKNGSPKGVR